jgi:catechol 2,3-dioxygenase-like lactoylglutathione lyase family enzyme
MKINLTSVLVDDQAKALEFYTEVLGFVKKNDVPLGQHRWLTVVSPEDPDGPELLLEPDEHPAARPFKRHSSQTAFRSRHSRSKTSTAISSGSRTRESASLRSRRRWAPSRRPCSTTPAATSYRSRLRTRPAS